MIRLELMTRPGCHLCDEMKEVLSRAARGLDVSLEEKDVSGDPELERLYGADVPVLLVNGRKSFQHRANEEELRRFLRSQPGP